jgi:K(+)-stimulated pyrophosphate-energized sodium pump
MGLCVVGLALLFIAIWFKVVELTAGDDMSLLEMTAIMLTFGMGASFQALFARVGGGIYTKAADVGADLVGKVEAGIPEDDPRNPATIADNVGDNVGDVAGMGADLYESYGASILAAAALGATAYIGSDALQSKAVMAPMLVAAIGCIFSVVGVFLVRIDSNAEASQKKLMGALERGLYAANVLTVLGTFGLFYLLKFENWWQLSLCVMVGMLVGVVIGKATEYYTSEEYKPTQKIAESAQGGVGPVIISGIGEGMISTVIPLLSVVVGTVVAMLLASGFDLDNVSQGLYGIGLAAVGMLSTLGVLLATDAYGPIADNAGGNAEMSHLPPEVRKRTDALDSLGNTTAATGKGFAIGSAAMTALALLASFVQGVKQFLVSKMEVINMERFHLDGFTGEEIMAMDLYGFMDKLDLHIANPAVLMGLFIGAMAAFYFCGLTMMAVARAASSMVDEVRRQFKEKPGILEGKDKPDYARCVSISTQGAQREMLYPSILAVILPIVVGLLFGVGGVLGLLSGALSAGFVLAVFMANAGGSWDNAKKYIETGQHGGKGSEAHKAAVVGDTVGDPFKDTSGPSLNILIKLMSIVAIVMTGVTVSFSLV